MPWSASSLTAYLPSETVHERCFVDGTVAPAHRGQGIGRELMAWAVDHGSELLGSSGRDLPTAHRRRPTSSAPPTSDCSPASASSPVRWFEELRRPLAELPPRADVDGVSIVGWPDGRDDELLDVRNAAFADHWGSTPTSPMPGTARPTASAPAPTSPSSPWMATTARWASVSNARYEADDEVTGRRDGWIMTLGTLAEWRGRGVASALIAASLDAFAAAGLTHAALGVDSSSPTGAARLYRTPRLRNRRPLGDVPPRHLTKLASTSSEDSGAI